MTFRWGILATGNIAASMAAALNGISDAELLAVASRSQAAADRFGEQWNVRRRYGSYAALAADPDVEIVYIATPHNLHFDNMLMCLNAGKHVLCEKPLTLNAHEAAVCVNLAREKGLFLMEAVWMRFFPAMHRVRQWVAAGEIGDIRLVQADFCFNLPFDPQHRLYDPALGGGALLDLGIYPLSFTTMLLGFPERVWGTAQLGETGVDELNALALEYDRGATAVLTSSMRINRPKEAFVVGSKGYIKVHETFFHPEWLTLAVDGQEPRRVKMPYLGNGYAHEVIETHECLRAGRTESAIMPLDESARMMGLMDGLRQRWGIQYPGEHASCR